MKMKNVIIGLIVIFFIYLQGCENTYKIPEDQVYFNINYLYPNPLSNKDTLTIGVDWQNHDINYSKIDDFIVCLKDVINTDTLQVIGLYEKYKTDSLRKTGIFNDSDESIQAIMSYSRITLQCVMDRNLIGNRNVEVINNDIFAKSNMELLIYKGN